MQLFVISHKNHQYMIMNHLKKETNLFATLLVINLKHTHDFMVGRHYHHCGKGTRMGCSFLVIS